MHDRDRARGVNQEIAILVRVILDGQDISGDPLDELNGLAKTAGANPFGNLIQRRKSLTSRSTLVPGKLKS